MGDRATLINDFVHRSDWAEWTRVPMAGDASSRRYERMVKDTQSVILMDAPPENGEDTRPFAQIATWLGAAGFCPPKILAHDATNGIMVLSDLGLDDFPRWLARQPSDAVTLYRAAVDILIHLRSQPVDLPLIRMTPDVASKMVGITGTFYAKRDVSELQAEVANLFNTHAHSADTFSLRDFHAGNLIWRAERTGLDRVGLLDFQDAFLAPAGYDLASLLRDVRRNVDAGLADQMTDYYIKATGADQEFRVQLACLGAQRNLRILGVFASLAKTRNKPHYIDLIPQTWENLMRDLDHPALSRLRKVALDCLPTPDSYTLNRLRG